MTTQYTPTLKLALPVTGELSGTWGDVVNDNITSMIEQAIAGLSTINTWTSNAHTLTTASGTTSESRCAMLVAATGGGAPTAAADIICPAAAKLYVLQNNTSFAVTLKTSAGTGVAVAAGDTAFLFCDATNVNSCVTTIVNGHITGNLTVDGNTTLGNATSDTITATARFASGLIPSADNTYDLGSSANSWKDLYIDGTATIATLNVTTIDTTNLEVTNIKAKDGTAALQIADTTGVVSVTAAPVMTALTASKPVFTDASKALTSSGTLAYDQGGTGQTSYAAGDIVYANATNTLAKLTIGSSGQRLVVAAGLPSWATDATVGTVTSVAMTVPSVLSISGSPITSSGTLALTYSGTALPVANGGTGLTAGTSGGVLAYTATGTLASSAALAASALVIGGGAGAAPSTTTTGTGVVTALGVNTGTAGAFVVNGGALGSPSSVGTMPAFTLGGTVSGGGNQINNVVIGTTTPLAGSFTTLSASASVSNVAIINSTAVAGGALVIQQASSAIGYLGNANYITGGTLNDIELNAVGGAAKVNISVQNTVRGAFSSTGLAVTGTLSATGAVTSAASFGSIAAGGTGANAYFIDNNTGTGANPVRIRSLGPDASTIGGVIIQGAKSDNSTITALATFAGTGAVTIPGTATIQGLTVGLGAGAVSNNTAVGASALAANTSGSVNTAVGFEALKSVTTASYNTSVGSRSLKANTTGANNSALGESALSANTTGANNTAIGEEALTSNTTASNNTAVGYTAGYSNTTGTEITAVGYRALDANTTGNENSAVGSDALGANTTGASNSAFGAASLRGNTTAADNTGLGYATLLVNTTGASNTAVGSRALQFNTTASNNTAVGYQAGYSNTTGSPNVAIGYQALYTNTTGSSQTAVGAFALGLNTTGIQNSATGYGALYANTTGNYNTANGYQALTANTTASNNTAVGYQAGYTNTTGTYNTFIGYQAGYTSNAATNGLNVAVGVTAGYSLTTGTNNTFIGTQGSVAGCGYYVTTGSKNTILGGYNGNQGSLDIRTASNYIVLSDGDGNPRGVFDNNGNFLLGATSTLGGGKQTIYASNLSLVNGLSIQNGTAHPSGAGSYINFYNSAGASAGYINQTGTTTVAYTTSSDYRLKENIAPITGALAKVAQLKPVTYKWKSDGLDSEGFIAHELAEVCPQAVVGEKDAVDADGNPKYQGIDTSFLVATLTAAIQEQQAIIESLKARLDAANL